MGARQRGGFRADDRWFAPFAITESDDGSPSRCRAGLVAVGATVWCGAATNGRDTIGMNLRHAELSTRIRESQSRADRGFVHPEMCRRGPKCSCEVSITS